MTRTTKNVTVRENNTGFVVRNNNTTVYTVDNYAKARELALALATEENKGAVADTDYYHEVIRKA